jgi:hypothetical protein
MIETYPNPGKNERHTNPDFAPCPYPATSKSICQQEKKLGTFGTNVPFEIARLWRVHPV